MDLNLTVVDELLDFLGILSVDGAAERDGSSEDLLDSAGEVDSHGLGSELFGDVDNVVHLDVSVVLHVLLLLSVSGAFLKSLDEEGSSGGEDSDKALSVLDHHFNLDFDSSPVSSGLLNIFTDFLGGHTERTALGGKGGSTGHFTSNDFEVHYTNAKDAAQSPKGGTYRISFQYRLAWEACFLLAIK